MQPTYSLESSHLYIGYPVTRADRTRLLDAAFAEAAFIWSSFEAK